MRGAMAVVALVAFAGNVAAAESPDDPRVIVVERLRYVFDAQCVQLGSRVGDVPLDAIEVIGEDRAEDGAPVEIVFDLGEVTCEGRNFTGSPFCTGSRCSVVRYELKRRRYRQVEQWME